MEKRKRRSFSDEFKADAVRLCRQGGQSVEKVASSLDIGDSVVRRWLKRADIDDGKSIAGELTTIERNELQELRRRVKRLEMEREILKKATAFFVKEHG